MATASLSRLLAPRSIAAFGGAWAERVVEQCQKMGFAGEVWPVHPSKREVRGVRCYASVADLPGAPDASFVAVNRSLRSVGKTPAVPANAVDQRHPLRCPGPSPC